MAEGNVTSVVQASSAGVKDMADGSLRITFEFEPRHAAEAFALFGPRGRSVAVAALRDGFAAVVGDDEQPVTVNPVSESKGRGKLGDLCWRAVQWCADPEFQRWIVERADLVNEPSEEVAKTVICSWCLIGSRRDLDTNRDAADRFNRLIRAPYQKHLIARGLA